MKDSIIYSINYLGAFILSFSLTVIIRLVMFGATPTSEIVLFLSLGFPVILGIVMIILPTILNRKIKHALFLDIIIMIVTWYYVNNYALTQTISH